MGSIFPAEELRKSILISQAPDRLWPSSSWDEKIVLGDKRRLTWRIGMNDIDKSLITRISTEEINRRTCCTTAIDCFFFKLKLYEVMGATLFDSKGSWCCCLYLQMAFNFWKMNVFLRSLHRFFSATPSEGLQRYHFTRRLLLEEARTCLANLFGTICYVFLRQLSHRVLLRNMEQSRAESATFISSLQFGISQLSRAAQCPRMGWTWGGS